MHVIGKDIYGLDADGDGIGCEPSSAPPTEPQPAPAPPSEPQAPSVPPAEPQPSPATSSAEAQDCDPNYLECVPIAPDVDCAGGPGDGPAYVQGPVHVIGKDIYGLDPDGDGIGCE